MCALLTRQSPSRVLKPKKGLIILGAIILGLMLSIVGVLLRSLFNRGIESPQVLEEHGISVHASIPLSEWQKARDSVKTIKGIKRYKQSQLLAVGNQPIWRLKPSAVCVPVCTSR